MDFWNNKRRDTNVVEIGNASDDTDSVSTAASVSDIRSGGSPGRNDSSTSFCSSDSSVTIIDGYTVEQKVQILNPKIEDRILLKMMNLDFPYDDGEGNLHFNDTRCIRGLEFLVDTHHLLVERRPENSIDLNDKDRLQCYSLLDVIDEIAQRIYLARERTTIQAVRYTRDARLFTIEVYNYKCELEGEVRSASGNDLMGRILQTGCNSSANYNIHDPTTGKIKILIRVNELDSDLFEVSYPFSSAISNRLPIAMIESDVRSTDARRNYNVSTSERAHPKGIVYIHQIPVIDKALILATVIFMEMCESRKEHTPQWIEHVPDDFKEERLPNIDLSNWDHDAIREQLFLRMRKQAQEETPNTMCSFWWKFCCCCCRWLYARNRIRCYLRLVFVLLLGLLLIAVIILII